jgi:hypothetical protein
VDILQDLKKYIDKDVFSKKVSSIEVFIQKS